MGTVNGNDAIITRSGCMFSVRPTRASDEAGLAEFFKYVTPEDMRFWFLTSVKEVGHERLFAMTNVDHHQTENFLVFVDNETEIFAIAMLACDADLKRGEVAIATRSDFKHDGVSWKLLKHATRYAESIGVKTIESIELRENHVALDVYEQETDLFSEDLSNEIIGDDVFQRLLTFPNALVTGHQAFLTEEALAVIAEGTLQSIADASAGRPLKFRIGAEYEAERHG